MKPAKYIMMKKYLKNFGYFCVGVCAVFLLGWIKHGDKIFQVIGRKIKNPFLWFLSLAGAAIVIVVYVYSCKKK